MKNAMYNRICVRRVRLAHLIVMAEQLRNRAAYKGDWTAFKHFMAKIRRFSQTMQTEQQMPDMLCFLIIQPLMVEEKLK